MRPKRLLGNPGLSRSLILAVLIALLPLAFLSIMQAVAARSYADDLIRERLLASTTAAATMQRDSFRLVRRMIAEYRLDPDVLGITPACSESLRRSLRGNTGPVANVIRWDSRGLMVCSALPMPSNPITARLPEWHEASRTGRFTVSAPFHSTLSGERVIAAIQPLTDRQGRFAGAISAIIDISWLERGLGQGHLSHDAQALIVDHRGKVLVGSGKSPSGYFPVTPALGKVHLLEGASQWLYSASPLVEGKLYLVYAEPQIPIFSTTRNYLYVSLALPILAVILSCLALWLAVRRLVLRWLTELTSVADHLREGRYPVANDTFDKAPYELAQLSEDMHDMANAIKSRDQRLVAAAERNLALAREVNHRVKNNLQIIVSLIAMQRSRLVDSDARKALEQAKARIAGIGLIHQLIYDERPGELGQVDMEELISGLCRQLHSDLGHDAITMDCEATGGHLPIDQAVPLTLFIIEAVTNSFRHAFPARGGTITLRLARADSSVTLYIADDGIGYDHLPDTATTGYTLMQAYAVQLRGSYALEVKRDEGLTLNLRFPVMSAENDAPPPG